MKGYLAHKSKYLNKKHGGVAFSKMPQTPELPTTIYILILAHNGVHNVDLWNRWLEVYRANPISSTHTIEILVHCQDTDDLLNREFCMDHKIPVEFGQTGWAQPSLVFETLKAIRYSVQYAKSKPEHNYCIHFISGRTIPIKPARLFFENTCFVEDQVKRIPGGAGHLQFFSLTSESAERLSRRFDFDSELKAFLQKQYDSIDQFSQVFDESWLYHFLNLGPGGHITFCGQVKGPETHLRPITFHGFGKPEKVIQGHQLINACLARILPSLQDHLYFRNVESVDFSDATTRRFSDILCSEGVDFSHVQDFPIPQPKGMASISNDDMSIIRQYKNRIKLFMEQPEGLRFHLIKLNSYNLPNTQAEYAELLNTYLDELQNDLSGGFKELIHQEGENE